MAGCSSSASSAPKSAADNRIERVRVAAGPGGYPSPIGPRREALLQSTLIFDTLVWKDSTGNVIPWLATAWQRSDDGTTWTFTLRDNARWQDGQALTSDDVKFTYDYLISGPAQVPAGTFGQVFIQNFIDVTAPSPTQVVFRMKRPWATFLAGIAGLVPILPKHIWATVTDPAKFSGPPSVVGSGPYRLESYDQATTAAAFVANDDFFLGPPKVKRIEFVPVTDELLALQRGDIDVANAGTEDQLPEQALAPFQNAKLYVTITGQQDWNRALHFNVGRGFPYNDKRFRQAIAYAIDRKDLVRRILFGRGEPGSTGGLAPTSPWAAPGLPTYDHDVAKSEALLDAIGLKDANGDGIRDLPDGSAFVPTIQTSAQFSTKTAELIGEYLRDVGIKIQVETLEATTADDSARAGRYDMALIGYAALGTDPDLQTRIRFSQAAVPLVFKAQGYSNPQLDALGLQQLFTADDAQRKAIVQDMQRIIADDLPILSLYVPTPSVVYRKGGFDDWYFTPGGFSGGLPGVLNKHALVTGKKAGF